MTTFSPAVLAYWAPLSADPRTAFTVGVADTLPGGRRVSVIRTESGLAAAVTAELAALVGEPADEAALRAALVAAGVRLNDPDAVHAFTVADATALVAEADADGVRMLTADDAAAFEAFIAASPEDDVDEAFVELDHWLVVGKFTGDEIVSAASAYPWAANEDGTDSGLADVGVLTAPAHRGRGHARDVVRALARGVLRRGHEAQYRCQLTNAASLGAARSIGLTRVGAWECDLRDDD